MNENPKHPETRDIQIPAWLAYAGVPLEDIPDDGQREEVRKHREESPL